MAELLHGSHPCGVPPPSKSDLRPARLSITTAAIRAPGIRTDFRLMLSGRTRSSDNEIPPGHLPLRTLHRSGSHARIWELRTRPAQPQCQNAKMPKCQNEPRHHRRPTRCRILRSPPIGRRFLGGPEGGGRPGSAIQKSRFGPRGSCRLLHQHVLTSPVRC